LRDARGAQVSVGLLGVDIDKDSQCIVQGFAYFAKALKSSPDICRPTLDLDRHKVAIPPLFHRASFERNVNNEVRPNVDFVR
jgi:hypothetical protein